MTTPMLKNPRRLTQRALSRLVNARRRPLPSRPAQPLAALCALLGAAVLLSDGASVQALQRAAGYTVGSGNAFAEVFDYLTGMRDGLAPLAIPAAGIGLAAAGFAYMAGSPFAQRVGTGVVLGTALVLLGPTIVQ